MTPEFVQRYAPQLAFRAPDGGGMAPAEPQGVDSTGTPRPYLQEAGRPETRQYFGELRGMLPPTEVAPRAPAMRAGEEFTPQDMIQSIPGEPSVMRGMRPGTPGNTARIPLDPRIVESEQRQREEIRSRSGEDGLDSGRWRSARSLGDLLAAIAPNFRFPAPAAAPDGLRGRDGGGLNDSELLPSVDVGVDYPPRSTGVLADYPNFATAEGLAEFNERTGLNLRNQVRSQRVQDRLRNQGATTARVSWHTYGRGGDIRPQDIGGLRGRAAVQEVRRRLQAAGYPDMEIYWESGRGHGQGTAPHVHIEPPGSPHE